MCPMDTKMFQNAPTKNSGNEFDSGKNTVCTDEGTKVTVGADVSNSSGEFVRDQNIVGASSNGNPQASSFATVNSGKEFDAGKNTI